MAKKAGSSALQAIGCFVNEDWEVRRFSEPDDRISWDNQLQYDQIGDAMTEWIQDYMKEQYALDELWLPTAEALEASGISNAQNTPSKLSRAKRVRFGSTALSRTPASHGLEDDKRSDDGDSRSDESEITLQWEKTPRSGVFTIDELDLPRISPPALIKHSRCNIFLSRNFWECERLLVLIQGSGPVRPGVWSRSVCITHNIHDGSIFDYLNIAKEAQMGVIILNPNANQIKLRVLSLDQPIGNFSAQHTYDIPGHHTHISHVLSIYDNFIAQCKAKDIYFVANGRGGDTLLQLLNHRLDQTVANPQGDTLHTLKRPPSTVANNLSRIRAIAFINSAHSSSYAKNDRVKAFIEERSVHWLTSPQPLDTSVPEQSDNFGCTCVSSGHTKPDFAAASAVNSVFEFFFGRIPPNEPHPDWNPVRIAFSNPPQNMHLKKEEKHIDEDGGKMYASEISTHGGFTSYLSESQNGIDFINDTASNGSSTSPRPSQHSRASSSHSNHQASLFEYSLPPPPAHHQIEMVEMGTQTDPIPLRSHQNDNGSANTSEPQDGGQEALTPTSGHSLISRGTLPVHPLVLSLCPFCKFSLWIQESKTRTFISLALLAAGVFVGRLFFGSRRSNAKIITQPQSSAPLKRFFFFQPH